MPLVLGGDRTEVPLGEGGATDAAAGAGGGGCRFEVPLREGGATGAAASAGRAWAAL